MGLLLLISGGFFAGGLVTTGLSAAGFFPGAGPEPAGFAAISAGFLTDLGVAAFFAVGLPVEAAFAAGFIAFFTGFFVFDTFIGGFLAETTFAAGFLVTLLETADFLIRGFLLLPDLLFAILTVMVYLLWAFCRLIRKSPTDLSSSC
jgi:hypothetical protein